MAENLVLDKSADKTELYRSLQKQVDALLEGEADQLANMANFCAAIHMAFAHHWIGFYLVKEDELVLGPFQGPIACTRIKRGRGVCGTAWDKNETLVVADVESFPGHIACSALSKSEVVIPVRKESTVIAVLDIDSSELNAFDETDRTGLESLVRTLEIHL